MIKHSRQTSQGQQPKPASKPSLVPGSAPAPDCKIEQFRTVVLASDSLRMTARKGDTLYALAKGFEPGRETLNGKNRQPFLQSLLKEYGSGPRAGQAMTLRQPPGEYYYKLATAIYLDRWLKHDARQRQVSPHQVDWSTFRHQEGFVETDDVSVKTRRGETLSFRLYPDDSSEFLQDSTLDMGRLLPDSVAFNGVETAEQAERCTRESINSVVPVTIPE